MVKKEILCSLVVLNKKTVTRKIADSILGPEKTGLVHFRTLPHIEYALNLEKAEAIEIKSEIPQHIKAQLAPVVVDVSAAKVTITKTGNPDGGETPEGTENPDGGEAPEGTENPDGGEAPEGEKPAWYLTFEQVEEMEKGELHKWAEENQPEGLKLAKSKNAAQTKEIVHEFLSGVFADHVAAEVPTEE